MNKSNFIQYVSILVIIIAVIVCGYILIAPKNQTNVQSQILSTNNSDLPSIVNGKQVINMTVMGSSYSPNYFKVKVGIPVQWNITSSGQSGCDSGAIVANGILSGITYLNPAAGQIKEVDFTPKSAGTYGFSCPMGMVRGTIEVVN